MSQDSASFGKPWSRVQVVAVDCMDPLRKISDQSGWITPWEILVLQEMVATYLDCVKERHDAELRARILASELSGSGAASPVEQEWNSSKKRVENA